MRHSFEDLRQPASRVSVEPRGRAMCFFLTPTLFPGEKETFFNIVEWSGIGGLIQRWIARRERTPGALGNSITISPKSMAARFRIPGLAFIFILLRFCGKSFSLLLPRLYLVTHEANPQIAAAPGFPVTPPASRRLDRLLPLVWPWSFVRSCQIRA